jgi:hypothetical protein
MESLLRLSGLLSEGDGRKTDLRALEKRLADQYDTTGLSASHNPHKINISSHSQTAMPKQNSSSHYSTPRLESQLSPRTAARSPESQKESEAEVEGLPDMMCSLVTNNCGETQYIGKHLNSLCGDRDKLLTVLITGSSSGFSIFSPKGIQWVTEKMGDTSFQEMISSAYVDDDWKPEIFSDIFAPRVFNPLPPKDEAMLLLKDFFDNFNCMIPLYHKPTFMHLVERQYS